MLSESARTKLRKRLYDEETGYLLNYLTLSISDPKLKHQMWLHIGKQFQRIIWPLTIFVIIGFINSCVNLYIYRSGHPINLVTGALDVLLICYFWVSIKCGRP